MEVTLLPLLDSPTAPETPCRGPSDPMQCFYAAGVPTDTFEHTTVVEHPRSYVWNRLQDPETWKSMGGIDEISDAETADGELLGFRFVSRIGGMSFPGTAHTTTSEPEKAMIVDVDTSELGAVLRVILSDDDDGTRLEVGMDLTSKGFLASMMWGMVAASVGAGLPDRTAALVASFD